MRVPACSATDCALREDAQLSTLIEACGEGFGALGKEPDRWVACEYVSERGEWSNAHEGETPEDAVARLWLSLHQAAANGTA